MNEEISKEEIKNREMFPKDTYAEEINSNITVLRNAIIKAIDDTQESEDLVVTVTEINSALIGVLAKMNSKELIDVLKYKKSLDVE